VERNKYLLVKHVRISAFVIS